MSVSACLRHLITITAHEKTKEVFKSLDSDFTLLDKDGRPRNPNLSES